MKKKFLGYALSACIAATSFVPVMAEDVATIKAGTIYADSGEEFVLPVTAQNAEDIASFTLELTYDSQYVSPVAGSLENDGANTFIQDVPGDSKVTIVAYGVNTKEIGEELFTYKFKTAEELSEEITTPISINIKNINGSDEFSVLSEQGIVKINSEPEQDVTPSAEPSESPEPTETPVPSESPEPTETPDPEKKEQSISFNPIADKQYGDEPFALELTLDAESGITDVTYSSSDENIATVSADGIVTITGAGICEIMASVAGNEEYAPAEAKVSFTSNKKLLSVYPNDLTIVYGEALPQNLVAFDGFVNDADRDEIEKQVVVSGLPETVTPGVYNLTLSGITSDKYKVDYSEGTLTIEKKPLTIESISVYDKAADGTTSAVINESSIVLSEVNVGDDVYVDIDNAAAEFAQAEIGEGIAVTITNLALTGPDADKYTLEPSVAQTTANIKETVTAAEMAATITSIASIAKDQRTVVLPNIGSAFKIAIASSSNEGVISTSGEIGYIDADTEVTLVLSVTNGEDTAQTQPITVTVPASTKVTITQGEMDCNLNGTGTYYKGQEVKLSVPSGYKVRGWYVGDTKVGKDTTTLTFTAEESIVIRADAFKHSGGSLAANVVSKVTSNKSDSSKVMAGTTITLETSTPGATIYYTTDGSTPTTSSNVYTDGIDLDESMVIKAIAVKKGMNNSSVSTFDYVIRYAETELKDNADTIKYMAAYADNTFRPDQAATRYEVINALNELLDIEESDNNKTFTDVDEEHFDVVSKFANVGIISGYGNGTFGGNRSITRAEFVTLLTKAWNIETESAENVFDDVSGHWASDEINSFAELGYVSGYPDGEFHPDDKVTRAEVVSVINRMVGTKSVSASQKYVDLAPTHWAYSQIMAVVA